MTLSLITFYIIAFTALLYFGIEGRHDAIITKLINKTVNMVEDWKYQNDEWHKMDAIFNFGWWVIVMVLTYHLYQALELPTWLSIVWLFQFAFARRCWFERGINHYRELSKYHMSTGLLDTIELKVFRTAKNAYYMRFIGWLLLSIILIITPLIY